MKKPTTHKPVQGKGKNLTRKIVLNVFSATIAALLLWQCYKIFPTYEWVHKGLLVGNYRFASANRRLTADQRREAKLGFNFKFLSFIRQNTPENAVIWMPSHTAYFPEGVESPFSGDVASKLYRLRVLYPRKIVDEGDPANKYAGQITHVAIINGIGYEQLNYTPEEKHPFAVFPIHKPE